MAINLRRTLWNLCRTLWVYQKDNGSQALDMIDFSKRIGGLTFMLVRCLAYSDEPFHSVSVGFDEDAGYYFAGNRDNKMIGQH